MKKTLASSLLSVALLTSAVLLPSRALAGDWPTTPGDFWQVTGVQVKDGSGLAYAKFLAADWRENQEYAKSKGWIKGYTVLSNVHPRKGEPDLYLVVMFDHLASGPEREKRNDEYLAWKKKTTMQMQKESGDRLQIREVQDSALLQEMKFK